MKTIQWRKGAWEGASGSSGAMSPSHSTSLALALLLISALPPCTGAPVFLDLSTTENDKLLNQIDNACSSLLSEERPLRTLDTLWDLCDLMQGVLQKSQELAARETTKRETPRTIQSRGYFLYRPRNGRRSTEYV